MVKSGGGVALAFDTGSYRFKLRHLKHIRKESEIMCATGHVVKIDRMVVVFVSISTAPHKYS